MPQTGPVADLPDLRLRSHRLVGPARSVVDAARTTTATQGQDFWAGRFALAQRTVDRPGGGPVTLRDVDAAFDRGELIRSWTMRGTLHVVLPADLPLLLRVTADRMRRAAAPRYRELGLDEQVRASAERLLRAALAGGNALTRAEVFAVLDGGGIDPTGQRGYHLIAGLAIDGVVCWGPVVDRPGGGITREQRLVLVDDWCPVSGQGSVAPEAAAAELFARYAVGHGPVTAADFAWWTGLPLGAARRAGQDALAAGAGRLRTVEIDGTDMVVGQAEPGASPSAPAPRGAAAVIALPPFDEYYLSYGDRSRVCAPEHLAAVGPGRNGMVRAIVIADGRVVGTWRVGWTPAPGAGSRAPAPAADLFVDVETDPLAAALGRAAAILTS